MSIRKPGAYIYNIYLLTTFRFRLLQLSLSVAILFFEYILQESVGCFWSMQTLTRKKGTGKIPMCSMYRGLKVM